jgi:hypothetical protein
VSDDGFTPYQRAINQLVRDQGSLAFQAVVTALTERLKELQAKWSEEQDNPGFDPDRLRAMNRGTVEVKKLIRDIGEAQKFFAEPVETHAGKVPVLTMEARYGATD